MNNPISIGLGGFLKAFEPIEAISKLASIGFSAFDLQLIDDWNKPNKLFNDDSYIDYYENLKKLLDSNNVKIGQTHGFFPLDNQDYDWLVETYKKQIHCTKLLGAKYIVVHPFIGNINAEGKDECFKTNIKFFNDIKSALIENDICACIENLWEFNENHLMVKTHTSNVDEINELLDFLNDDKHFGICIDTGHLNIVNEDIYENIIKASSRLKVLHINDNEKSNDTHNFPTCGNINWLDVVKGLKEIDYKGNFNMEIVVYNRIKDIDKSLAYTNAEYAYEIASSIIGKE